MSRRKKDGFPNERELRGEVIDLLKLQNVFVVFVSFNREQNCEGRTFPGQTYSTTDLCLKDI